MRAERLWDGIDILLHEHQPFDCVLQFCSVRCDVTSENSRQMYESTPFCLVNNKVLYLRKYCEFDQQLIGYVFFIHSSAMWTKIVLPLHFYFKPFHAQEWSIFPCSLTRNITSQYTLLFIAYSGETWLYYQFSLPHLYISPWKGWDNVLFELGSERVKS